MITIWKYPLQVVREQKVAVPIRSETLSIQMQDGAPCMWRLVDKSSPDLQGVDQPLGRTAHMLMYGTGGDVKDPPPGMRGAFIATVQDGPYVWHFFELRAGDHK